MRRAVLFSVLVIGLAWTSSTANAHQAPAGCLANGVDLTLGLTQTLVRPGDTLTFRVGIRNDNTMFGTPCHLTNTKVGIRLPGANGRYNPLADSTTIKDNETYNSLFAFTEVARFDWVVTLDPRVEFGNAQAVAQGKLHLTPLDPDSGQIVKDVSFIVTNPSITIDKTGSIQNGTAPQNVTYTYVVTNTSQTPVPMRDLKVSDDLCAGPQYASGDNGDGVLSNGENWTFTCASLHQAAGTYTNTAKACATSNVDGREVCSPPDTWTVVLTPPPPPPPVPDSGVKPATATQAPCDIVSPTGLKVRAKELTTIRVRVRNVDAGSEARITLPGGKVLRAKVNSSGIATFKVRPPKSGRATIRMAECGDVARFTVRKARQVQTRRAPRVTG